VTDGPERPTSSSTDAAGDEPAASHVAATGDSLEERVVGSRVVHRGHYMDFRVLTIERADGSRAERDVVWHPGAVAIVAFDEADRLLLVRQWRIAAGAALLELPAGTLDVDAATGRVEDPDAAAARELEEETGYRAGRLERLADFWTAPGFATERMWLYLAADLRPAHADRLGPDEDERLELERMAWPDAVTAVEQGQIRDAKSIVGILAVARRRETRARPS
jgi:8-oxo-dGTP pyrophosphatase MutT (NUDIX family)